MAHVPNVCRADGHPLEPGPVGWALLSGLAESPSLALTFESPLKGRLMQVLPGVLLASRHWGTAHSQSGGQVPTGVGQPTCVREPETGETGHLNIAEGQSERRGSGGEGEAEQTGVCSRFKPTVLTAGCWGPSQPRLSGGLLLRLRKQTP